MSDMFRICPSCKAERYLTLFRKNKDGKPYGSCNECRKKKRKSKKVKEEDGTSTMLTNEKIEEIKEKEPIKIETIPIDLHPQPDPIIEISSGPNDKIADEKQPGILADVKKALEPQPALKPDKAPEIQIKQDEPIIITTNIKPETIPQQKLAPSTTPITQKRKYPPLTKERRELCTRKMTYFCKIMGYNIGETSTLNEDQFWAYWEKISGDFSRYARYCKVEGIFYSFVAFLDKMSPYVEHYTQNTLSTEGIMEIMSEPEIKTTNKPVFYEIDSKPEISQYFENPWLSLGIPLAEAIMTVSTRIAEKKFNKKQNPNTITTTFIGDAKPTIINQVNEQEKKNIH